MYEAFVFFPFLNITFQDQLVESLLEGPWGVFVVLQAWAFLSDPIDRLELVEDRMQQSKRLMVILTPDPEITDQRPASPQISAIGDFDWQVGVLAGSHEIFVLFLGCKLLWFWTELEDYLYK